VNALLLKIRDLLTGEPLRAITYGAIAVVWIVTHAAFAVGVLHNPPPEFDVILAAVSGAIALLNEVIRLYVYSPNSVAAMGAIASAPPASAAPPAESPASEPDALG
jgi:RsiW-degrading membrane proteinase PrsW (M82 family)